jgi:RNA recognition motif-containing protein
MSSHRLAGIVCRTARVLSEGDDRYRAQPGGDAACRKPGSSVHRGSPLGAHDTGWASLYAPLSLSLSKSPVSGCLCLATDLTWTVIVNVFLPKDRVAQVHQRFGFCEFVTDQDADDTMKSMNMIKLHGRPLRVNKVGCSAVPSAVPSCLLHQLGCVDSPMSACRLWQARTGLSA